MFRYFVYHFESKFKSCSIPDLVLGNAQDQVDRIVGTDLFDPGSLEAFISGGAVVEPIPEGVSSLELPIPPNYLVEFQNLLRYTPVN
jgi:hypothetical protein